MKCYRVTFHKFRIDNYENFVANFLLNWYGGNTELFVFFINVW